MESKKYTGEKPYWLITNLRTGHKQVTSDSALVLTLTLRNGKDGTDTYQIYEIPEKVALTLYAATDRVD